MSLSTTESIVPSITDEQRAARLTEAGGFWAKHVDADKKNACYREMDDFFLATVRRGRARDGRVYMPPFEGTLSQEAIWTVRTYLETRRAN